MRPIRIRRPRNQQSRRRHRKKITLWLPITVRLGDRGISNCATDIKSLHAGCPLPIRSGDRGISNCATDTDIRVGRPLPIRLGDRGISNCATDLSRSPNRFGDAQSETALCDGSTEVLSGCPSGLGDHEISNCPPNELALCDGSTEVLSGCPSDLGDIESQLAIHCPSDLGDCGNNNRADVRPVWIRVLQRVPQGLRENKEQLYDPSVMSLGPYHHRRPQLRQFKEFKDKMVNFMLKEEEKRHLFRGKILERVNVIRHFYGGLLRGKLSDDALAEMMVRDACALLFFLELNSTQDMEKFELAYRLIGIHQMLRAWDDIFKLENQIPWWLMNSLISLTYNGDEEGRKLILRLLSFQAFGNYDDLKQLPWDDDRDEYNPLHFLEAIRKTNPIAMAMINNDGTKKSMNRGEATSSPAVQVDPASPLDMKKSMKKSSSSGMLRPGKRSFRSVRELKAKGIYFNPSKEEISFTSYYVFGVLHLPVLAVSKDTKVAFSNIMALEMSPGSPGIDLVVTSHLTFMKSMIQSSEDVKWLQEKGIIVSFLDNNEEIVKMFKEMDTIGVDMLPLYDEIKIRINHHCDSKARTWIAELINTNFHSPWTAIALLSAAFLLCLTFLQTYYTMNPK